MKQAIYILLMVLLVGTPAIAQERPGQQLRRLGENLAKLDLSPDQQLQVKAAVDEMIAKLDEIRRDARPGERPMAKIVDVVADGRSKLTGILNADQQFRLRELMQNDRAEAAKTPEPKVDLPARTPEPPALKKPEPPVAKTPEPPALKKPEPKMDDMMSGPGTSGRTGPGEAEPEANIVGTGVDAPAFTLKSTGDRPFASAGFKGRVVVLVFGSYTSPIFRQRVAAMEKLAKDTTRTASFFVIYTREAHAHGEWEVERNKDENIQVEQPRTDAERKEQAKQAVSTLKITVPVLVDGMDDAVAKAYGLSPNGAVVIGRDGKIFARQKWFEPVALRQHIDAASAVKNTPQTP